MSMGDFREADKDLQLDVHVLIFDYIIHNATDALLEDAPQGSKPLLDSAQSAMTKNHLIMVDSAFPPIQSSITTDQPTAFLTIFKIHHPKHIHTALTTFRLKLLQFTTLLHLIPSDDQSLLPTPFELTTLRAAHASRAASYISRARLRASNVFDSVTSHSSARISDPSALNLTDIIPLFIALTASRVALASDFALTPRWLRLTAALMQRASMCGPAGLDVFAWGPVDVDDDLGAQHDDAMQLDDEVEDAALHALFRIPDVEGAAWVELREAAIRGEEMGNGDVLVQVRGFLQAMLRSVALPVLVSLEGEDGDEIEVDGVGLLNEQETSALKRIWDR